MPRTTVMLSGNFRYANSVDDLLDCIAIFGTTST